MADMTINASIFLGEYRVGRLKKLYKKRTGKMPTDEWINSFIEGIADAAVTVMFQTPGVLEREVEDNAE